MATEITIGLFSALGGFLIGYLTSYFNEKGKNRATIEDTKSLTEEKEKVSSRFELDNSKRKYQYEYKSNLYFKYFNLLDELNTKANEEAQIEFIPYLNAFNADFLGAAGNQEKELKAASDFGAAVNKIMMKANESQIKLKNETNSLKLIAGDSVLNVLEEIEKTNDLSFNLSADMMRELGGNMVSKRMDILDNQKSELQVLGNELIRLKEKLTQEIRKELNEI